MKMIRGSGDEMEWIREGKERAILCNNREEGGEKEKAIRHQGEG